VFYFSVNWPTPAAAHTLHVVRPLGFDKDLSAVAEDMKATDQ